MKRPTRPRPLILFSTLFLSLLTTTNTFAHGRQGQLRLENVQVGPYRLDAWTYPLTLQPGEVEVEALITDSGTGSPCLVCSLAVTVSSSENDVEYSVEAEIITSNTEDQQYYHAAFQLDDPGTYTVTLDLQASGQSVGQVNFDMDVSAPDPEQVPRLQMYVTLMGIGWLIFISLIIRSARKAKI